VTALLAAVACGGINCSSACDSGSIRDSGIVVAADVTDGSVRFEAMAEMAGEGKGKWATAAATAHQKGLDRPVGLFAGKGAEERGPRRRSGSSS